MSKPDTKPCACETCRYSTEIQALAKRQATPEDRKRVDDLYMRFSLAEDDNGMYRGRWRDTKPVLCLLRMDHFLAKGHNIRLDGHEECPVCALLERIY